MTIDDVHDFDRPPVVETILRVQFDRLDELHNAHLGAFWKTLCHEWPNTLDAPPLEPQFENFDSRRIWSNRFQLKLSTSLDVRLQMKNADDDRMIQLQNGCLIYNWLGHQGKPYPRYREIKREFEQTKHCFEQFLRQESLGPLRPNQWEVTYVNHIPKGTVWNRPSDWADLFTLPASKEGALTDLEFEGFNGEWHFEIPPQLGRLHVTIFNGRGPADSDEELLVMTLTARGAVRPPEEGGLSVEDGLDRGRFAIVKTFKNMTSASAHKVWGLKT